MAEQKLTEREVRFARYFLRALHANETNGYLLLSVIAWMRGAHASWLGNNPLNLLNAAGVRMRYGSLDAGAKALAYKLTHGSSTSGYSVIVAAARRLESKDSGRVTQARDFLYALALSSWDTAHYGVLRPNPYGELLVGNDQTKNRLLPIWYALTGQKIPADWFTDGTIQPKPVVPPKPPFRQDSSSVHRVPRAEYLQPYASLSFYEGRPHLGDNVLLPD